MRRRLDRILKAIDVDMANASDRTEDHRELKERLEDVGSDARAVLAQGRAYLNDVSTVAAYAKDKKDFLVETRRGGPGGGHSVPRRGASQAIEQEL